MPPALPLSFPPSPPSSLIFEFRLSSHALAAPCSSPHASLCRLRGGEEGAAVPSGDGKSRRGMMAMGWPWLWYGGLVAWRGGGRAADRSVFVCSCLYELAGSGSGVGGRDGAGRQCQAVPHVTTTRRRQRPIDPLSRSFSKCEEGATTQTALTDQLGGLRAAK